MGTCDDESSTVAEAQPLRLKHKPKTLILKHHPCAHTHVIHLSPALYPLLLQAPCGTDVQPYVMSCQRHLSPPV